MPYISNFITYLGTNDYSSSCPIYGLYIDKCGKSYTNNFQVAVNGVYLGDFNGSKTPYEFVYYYPDIPDEEVCPVVTSVGAPEYCDHGNPFWSTLPSIEPGKCGGDIARLFMLTSQTPFAAGVFPNGKSQPDGARWPSTNINSALITWHGNVNFIGESFIPTGSRVNPSYSNNIELYSYFDYYDGSVCSWGSPLIPRVLEGVNACIGIIRYKKINGYLHCDKFLPVQPIYSNGFTNKLSFGSEIYQDSFRWWGEASIPVAHDPLPDWVPNKTYYW